MKTIIAGGRDFSNTAYYTLMAGCLKDIPWEITEVVSGGARGADRMGERWADEYMIPIKLFPADWKTYPKAAGPIRNKQMAEYADALVAFWDGKSRGTKNMIEIATNKGLRVKVFEY